MKSKVWPSLPLRRLGTIVGGGTPTPADENWEGNIPFVTPPDLRPVVGRIVSQTERSLTERGATTGSSMAPADSVLLSIRAPIGYVARTTTRVAFNQGCRAIVPGDSIEPRFLVYALLAASGELESVGRGTTFTEISSAQMAAFEVPTPPITEQRAIADYLDRETAQIDTLIVKQEQLIATLRERRAAIWSRHFASALNKSHTSVRRVLRPLSRPASPGLGVVTVYRDGTVTLRSNRRTEGYTVSYTESGYQEIRRGDLVFHALDGFAGAVGVSDSRGNGSPVYHVCEALNGNSPEYVARLLRFLGTSGFLSQQAPNVRERSIDFRNWQTFARVPLDLAPAADQTRLVERLSAEESQIDRLIAKADRFIDLSKERRAALISATVTGQVDVSGELPDGNRA